MEYWSVNLWMVEMMDSWIDGSPRVGAGDAIHSINPKIQRPKIHQSDNPLILPPTTPSLHHSFANPKYLAGTAMSSKMDFVLAIPRLLVYIFVTQVSRTLCGKNRESRVNRELPRNCKQHFRRRPSTRFGEGLANDMRCESGDLPVIHSRPRRFGAGTSFEGRFQHGRFQELKSPSPSRWGFFLYRFIRTRETLFYLPPVTSTRREMPCTTACSVAAAQRHLWPPWGYGSLPPASLRKMRHSFAIRK